MGDVRTHEGYLVPEKYVELYDGPGYAICHLGHGDRVTVCADYSLDTLISELASWQARAEQAEAENKRLKEALDVIPAALEWEYRGEGLYITFLNPWKDWKRQDLLCFMWPIHPPEVTGAVETYYETIAEAICRLRSLAGQEKKEGGQNE